MFENLPDMWTVFILSKDPFETNRMCYTVKNRILEEPDLPYEDGAVSLFFYTKGNPDGNEELARLLHYIEESTEENAVTGELKALHEYIISIKKRKEVGVRYMKSLELERMWRQEGRKEGLEEGREKGLTEGKVESRIQDILDLLDDLGTVPRSLARKISGETDTATLRRWVKLAAKAESHADFEKNM